MKIGELGHRGGVSTKTIRYYEGIGLLPAPRRSPNGYRDYDEAAVARLQFIRDAQATGLTLTEVSSILELRQAGETTCHHVVELLEDHLGSLERHISQLERTRAALTSLTARARSLDPANCTDPIRCQTIASGRPGGDTAVEVHERPHAHRH